MNTDLDDVPATETIPADALTLRRPDIPVTLSELAALKGEALEVVNARVQVLETLRKAAIRMTSPEDWLLFKSPDDQGGQIVGYLQDAVGAGVLQVADDLAALIVRRLEQQPVLR